MCVNELNNGISNKHKIPIKINILGVNKTNSNNLFKTIEQNKNKTISEKYKIILILLKGKQILNSNKNPVNATNIVAIVEI